MQNERKIRVANHMTRKGREIEKKRNMICLTLIFVLLFSNIVLLCKLQIQMKHIHNALAVVLDELELYQEDWDRLESDAQNGITESDAAGLHATGQVTTGRDGTGSVAMGLEPTGYDTVGSGLTGSNAAGQGSIGQGSAGQVATGHGASGQGQAGSDAAGQGSAKHGITGKGNGAIPDELSDSAEVDYVTLCGLSEVDVPVRRTRAEALVRLKELAKESELISDVYKNNRSYSDNMLGALANNPEMADFVAGYLDAPAKATGAGLTEAEKEQEYPLFLQWDPRWGYAEYGDNSNIGLAGCGPVCLSMALYYLLDDESLTPDKIAEYSMKNGYYVSGTGTAWSLLTDVPAKYGVDVNQPGVSEQNMKKALDEGSIIICSMRPGDFTANGHFIVIYGYDKEGFQVNDPNCVARSREQWLFDEIGKQIKHIWVLSEKKLDIGERVEYYK